MRFHAVDEDLAPGAAAGDYVVERKIARGGCGTVYSATHSLLARRAAVKVLHGHLATSPQMVERFVREARAANVIRHPNIVDIFEFGVLPDERPYFVMELVDGTDLDALLHSRGRLGLDEVLEILEPVCGALEAAHAAGIVHRDLKASNVVVSQAGGHRVVKLLDFGIAKLVDPEPNAPQLTSVGRRLGTPLAMAPEQIRGGTIDARTDVYALGVLVFHMLTGRYPFPASDPLELERLHVEAPPPRPSEIAPVPPAIDALVLRCLEKQPEARFPTARAVLDAFRSGAATRLEPVVSAAPSSAQTRPAVAIHLEVLIDASDEEQLETALLDDLAAVLDTAEQTLSEAGYLTPLQTSNAVLGVRPLEVESEAADRHGALALALRLRAALDARSGSDRRLSLALTVHTDRVAIRESARGAPLVTGPLMRVAAWAVGRRPIGVSATRKLLDGLPPPPGPIEVVG